MVGPRNPRSHGDKISRLDGCKTRDSARAAMRAIIDAGLLVPITDDPVPVYKLVHSQECNGCSVTIQSSVMATSDDSIVTH